jgi:hypothetical protein
MRKPRAARSSPGRQNRYIGTKDFLRLEGLHLTLAVQGVMNISRRSSSHGNVAGDGLVAQFGTGLRPRHILEFRQGADPILRTVMCDPISAVRYMARWTGALWRRTICLGTRWRLRLTLTRLTFTTKLSEAEISVGPCEVFTGASLHVHAEHYRESRSEAHTGQSLYVYFHRTSPLYTFH